MQPAVPENIRTGTALHNPQRCSQYQALASPTGAQNAAMQYKDYVMLQGSTK
jgi:hypothetical protein